MVRFGSRTLATAIAAAALALFVLVPGMSRAPAASAQTPGQDQYYGYPYSSPYGSSYYGSSYYGSSYPYSSSYYGSSYYPYNSSSYYGSSYYPYNSSSYYGSSYYPYNSSSYYGSSYYPYNSSSYYGSSYYPYNSSYSGYTNPAYGYSSAGYSIANGSSYYPYNNYYGSSYYGSNYAPTTATGAPRVTVPPTNAAPAVSGKYCTGPSGEQIWVNSGDTPPSGFTC